MSDMRWWGRGQNVESPFLHTCCYVFIMYFALIIVKLKCAISPEDDASIWEIGRYLKNSQKCHYAWNTMWKNESFRKQTSFHFLSPLPLSLLLILLSVSPSADVCSKAHRYPTTHTSFLFIVSAQI